MIRPIFKIEISWNAWFYKIYRGFNRNGKQRNEIDENTQWIGRESLHWSFEEEAMFSLLFAHRAGHLLIHANTRITNDIWTIVVEKVHGPAHMKNSIISSSQIKRPIKGCLFILLAKPWPLWLNPLRTRAAIKAFEEVSNWRIYVILISSVFECCLVSKEENIAGWWDLAARRNFETDNGYWFPTAFYQGQFNHPKELYLPW